MSQNSDKVWTVLSMLEWATDYFEKKQVNNPRLSIEWLLAHTLGIKRLDLYLKFDRPLAESELELLRPLVKRRADHEPLQYITGSTEFMSCTIKVNRDVLIPRTETEQLVELLLNRYPADPALSLLDLGTGSGCIPISIKQERPDWYCAGLDISPEAIDIAKENAALNDVDVAFFESDLNYILQDPTVTDRNWDIVISNPPYITEPEKGELDPQVLEYEPELALFHREPLLLYKKICEFASAAGAVLFLECNDKLTRDINNLALSFYGSVELIKDYDDKDRFVICTDPLN